MVLPSTTSLPEDTRLNLSIMAHKSTSGVKHGQSTPSVCPHPLPPRCSCSPANSITPGTSSAERNGSVGGAVDGAGSSDAAGRQPRRKGRKESNWRDRSSRVRIRKASNVGVVVFCRCPMFIQFEIAPIVVKTNVAAVAMLVHRPSGLALLG